MLLDYSKFFKFTFFIVSIVIFNSFFFEVYFELKPCKLCLVQRFLWIFYGLICFLAIFRRSYKRLILLISLCYLFVLSFIGIYHSFVELGIMENVFTCSLSTGMDAKSIDELSEIILNTDNNDCAFPKFTFYGLTLANLGAICSIFLLILNLLLLRKELFKNYG